MSRLGRQSDLARELGISKSAVSQAFKKFDIQIAVNGLFDLDHATWLLEKKQNQAKSKGQRSADKKSPAGLRNPKVKREIIRLLWPAFDEAICSVIQKRVEISFVNEADCRDLENYLLALMAFWTDFHRIIDRQIPPDMGDFPWRRPDSIDFDIMKTSVLDQVQIILSKGTLAETSSPPPGKAASDE